MLPDLLFQDISQPDLHELRSIQELPARTELLRFHQHRIHKKLTVKVNAVSETAKSKIEAAGGTVELI